jgi:hypothetical protein
MRCSCSSAWAAIRYWRNSSRFPQPRRRCARETTRRLTENEPRLKRLSPEKRQALIEFIIGNMLFVAAHELGHGVLAELQLPNLRRDEDAGDVGANWRSRKLKLCYEMAQDFALLYRDYGGKLKAQQQKGKKTKKKQ